MSNVLNVRRFDQQLIWTGMLFHKQICGPLANSLFHHQPDAALRPKSKLETAFHKADISIQNIICLLKAA
jgi:hypothetical protein